MSTKLKFILTITAIIAVETFSPYRVQSQGISFSYLIPKNGYVSAPVSPFSIRGVGFQVVDYTRVESGFSLYSMSGLAMDGLPFRSDRPLTGPHFALLVPAELVFSVGVGRLGISVMGGGFGHWHINPRINYGEMDRAVAAWESWSVANADMGMEVKLGWGWLAGGGLEYQVNDQFSLTAEAHYLQGFADAPMQGIYTGGPDEDGNVVVVPADFPDARIVVEGVELSLGVRFSPN
ncbi:MAG: hypothetical protein RIF33_17970 [Cyclobacteriaceae bacterium]